MKKNLHTEGSKAKKNFLVCKTVKYHSQGDADAFFAWLDKIPSIEKIVGYLDELYIFFKSKKISSKEFIELSALFYRYNIDMKQLNVFLTKKEKEEFGDGYPQLTFEKVWPHTNKSLLEK